MISEYENAMERSYEERTKLLLDWYHSFSGRLESEILMLAKNSVTLEMVAQAAGFDKGEKVTRFQLHKRVAKMRVLLEKAGIDYKGTSDDQEDRLFRV